MRNPFFDVFGTRFYVKLVVAPIEAFGATRFRGVPTIVAVRAIFKRAIMAPAVVGGVSGAPITRVNTRAPIIFRKTLGHLFYIRARVFGKQ